MEGEYVGKYRAIVVDVKDEEERGRIQVLCPHVYGEDRSPWCEPVIPYAYEDGGDFIIPRIGDFVWIEFERGDSDMPIYFGSLWSSKHSANEDVKEDYKNRCDKVRQIEFAGNKVLMYSDTYPDEEKKGSVVVSNAENKVQIHMKKDGTLSITASKDVEVNAQGSMTFKATGNMKFTANRIDFN